VAGVGKGVALSAGMFVRPHASFDGGAGKRPVQTKRGHSLAKEKVKIFFSGESNLLTYVQDEEEGAKVPEKANVYLLNLGAKDMLTIMLEGRNRRRKG
jgi:hypothetical protein